VKRVSRNDFDSHQHVHREDPVRSILQNLARQLAVPLREQTPGISYCGDFYGQDAESQTIPGALSLAAFKNILASLPDGYTELGCHPDYDDGLASAYRVERAAEVQTLCSPEIPSRAGRTANRVVFLQKSGA
jgi:chitin disaccharide deacetylase